jgi:hypothetical protein
MKNGHLDSHWGWFLCPVTSMKDHNKNQWLKPSYGRQKGKSKDALPTRTKERKELILLMVDVMDRLQTSGVLQDKTSFIDPSTSVDLLKGCSPYYLLL